MAGIEEGISAALAYAADNRHGYELQSRDYDLGTDCAGLARLYAAAVEGIPLDNYPNFHTWTQVATLTARGWQDIPFSTSAMRRGDVLLRALGDSTGHTVVYLGDGWIVGAEGNWDGRHGDSSGTEVTKRTYYPYNYNHILRPPTIEEKDMTDEQAAWLKAVYDEVTRRDDPTGRGQNMTTHEHVKFIAQTVSSTNEEVKRTDDPTGRNLGMLDHDKLHYMAAKQQTMYDALKAVCAKLDIPFGEEESDADTDSSDADA